jgi:hypothetical protein
LFNGGCRLFGGLRSLVDDGSIRSNYGIATDAVFARDWPRLKQARLVRGAYLFLRFPRGNKRASTPEAQAAAAIDTIGDLEDVAGATGRPGSSSS